MVFLQSDSWLLSLLAVSLISSAKLLHNYGKAPFVMGKFIICMAIFNSYVIVITGGYLQYSLSIIPSSSLLNYMKSPIEPL